MTQVLVANFSVRSSAPFQEDFIIALATAGLECISESPAFSRNTEQFFDVTITLLSSLDQTYHQQLDIDTLIDSWASLLIAHKHVEVSPPSSLWCTPLTVSRLSAGAKSTFWFLGFLG